MTRFIDKILRKTNRKEIVNALEDAIVVSADNVAQYLEDTRQWTINSAYELPNIAPPFQKMFIEFYHPNQIDVGWYIYAFDRQKDENPRLLYGESDASKEARWVIQAFMFIEKCPYVPQFVVELFVAGDGKLLEAEEGILFQAKPSVGSAFTRKWTEEDSKLIESIAGFFVGALWAICFMNTKNVVQEDIHPEPKLNKVHVKKYHRPMTVYRVLKVSPMSRERGEDKGGTHSSPSLHIRRGHFKHYGDDAPLFGRIVGTFWYNEVMVGKQEQGEIDKSYEVLPNQPLA